jgi:hypothetical protein
MANALASALSGVIFRNHQRRGFGSFRHQAQALGVGTSQAVSGIPRGYISPNFKVLASNIPAREHGTPTHGRRERY